MLTTFNVHIDPAVRSRFPDIAIAFAVIRGISLNDGNPELERLRHEILDAARRELTKARLDALPSIQAFRDTYRRFGVDPRSRRPSAEALLRRVLDPGKDLYRINSVVDSYNLSSIESRLPIAAYDLDRLSLPIELRFAREGETHTAIGAIGSELLSAGELVYADQVRVICRDFNYRDADETKVTKATKNLLVCVDACGAIDRRTLDEALNRTTGYITSINGGTVESTGILPAS